MDSVWIAERQHREPNLLAHIFDPTMWHATLVKNLDRAIEFLPAADGEPEMVEAHTEFVELIVAPGAPLVAEAEDQRTYCSGSSRTAALPRVLARILSKVLRVVVRALCWLWP